MGEKSDTFVTIPEHTAQRSGVVPRKRTRWQLFVLSVMAIVGLSLLYAHRARPTPTASAPAALVGPVSQALVKSATALEAKPEAASSNAKAEVTVQGKPIPVPPGTTHTVLHDGSTTTNIDTELTDQTSSSGTSSVSVTINQTTEGGSQSAQQTDQSTASE